VSFFRRHEPSSPVPLVLERARRLVSKSFMEVLADVAPEGLPQAKLIVGIRSDAE
jgi:type VI secretion system protein ImpA